MLLVFHWVKRWGLCVDEQSLKLSAELMLSRRCSVFLKDLPSNLSQVTGRGRNLAPPTWRGMDWRLHLSPTPFSEWFSRLKKIQDPHKETSAGTDLFLPLKFSFNFRSQKRWNKGEEKEKKLSSFFIFLTNTQKDKDEEQSCQAAKKLSRRVKAFFSAKPNLP